jgi:heavy metal sensor kinase
VDALISLRPKHVRARLTLWYVGLVATVLVLSWSLVGLFLFVQLRSQIDHYAIQDIETVEGLLFFDSAGQLQLREDYHNHAESKQVLDWLLEVRSPDGKVLYRNERLADRALDGVPFRGEGVGGYSVRSRRLTDGTRVRLVSRRHSLDGHEMIIRLAYSEGGIWSRVEEVAAASALALPLVLAIAGLVGYWLARRALEPVERMTQQAERITPGLLHERLPAGTTDDELGHLAKVFNDLLSRLEQSFQQLYRFTSDASHELRTPLTLIRSVGEVGLQKSGTVEEYRDTIGSMLEEVNRLTSLVENLLTIARADAGQIPLRRSVFGAMELAREAGALLEVLIEDKHQRVLFEGDEQMSLEGDRLLLRQALVNIVHNAVKFSPEGGAISVRILSQEGDRVGLEIADTGPGISPEHAAKIFDRFFRADGARTGNGSGAGLGLSIARWAVQMHGGEIKLMSVSTGCVFQIWLPAAGPPVAQTLPQQL